MIISNFKYTTTLKYTVKSNVLNQYMCICKDILLRSSTKLNKRFQEFMIETLLLYIVIPKRINFLQLGRYSSSSEQRFRQNYSKHFDWMGFNCELSKDVLTSNRHKYLTSINLAKAYAIKIGKPFSIASIKTMIHNAFSARKIYWCVWY